MNAKSKKTLKAAALAAGLAAVLLPTGCAEQTAQPPTGMQPAPGAPHTVVAPLHTD